MRHALFPVLIAMAMLILLVTGPACAQQEFADSVDQAIERGVKFLLSQQQPDGSWVEFEGHEDKRGMTPLVAYALMEAGVSPQSEPILKALAFLEKEKLSYTYAVSLRALAMQYANDQTNDKYFKTLKEDVELLILAGTQGGGSYNYGTGGAWDNSNGQYAVLGAWAGAENGRIPIKDAYWRAVQNHWYTNQNADGGWGYNGTAPGGYYTGATQATMTVGGIATLYICEDNLPPSSAVVRCENVVLDPHIQRGLQLLDQNFFLVLQRPKDYVQEWYYYFMYGVERAAIASGYKYLGGQDWYRVGVDAFLSKQEGNGSWMGEAFDETTGAIRPGIVQANTSFALLFLIRGRQPLLFNKLEFNGDWDNRSRDMAAATRWLSRTYENSVNWQIVSLGSPLDDWRDAPIMYISAKGPFNFTSQDVAKLREYVLQGGTILSVAERNGPEFNSTIREFYKQAFPEYSLEACGPDHRLYKYPNALDPTDLQFFELSNGVRPLAIHVENPDNDLSLAWQKRDFVRDRWAFQAAANIVLYSVENLIDLPARGVNLWPAGQQAAFAGSTGGGAYADLIYLVIGGQLAPTEAANAGQQVQTAEGIITIPRPDAPGRTIVYCAPTDQYISVPDEYLGQTLPAPNGAPFVAQKTQPSETEATAPALVTPPPGGSRIDITVIRVQNANNAANCNPEPLAWLRFAALMEQRTKTGVAVVGPINIKDLPDQAAAHNARLAVLTGTNALEVSPEEKAAIKQFIDSGGTIFMDAAGGSQEFTDSLSDLLREEDMYGRIHGKLRDMPSTAPLFNLSSHEIKSVEYRVRTAVRVGTNEPTFKTMLIDTRPVIIISPEDVTTGLVGFNSGAFEGYTPESSFKLMRNVVLSMGR